MVKLSRIIVPNMSVRPAFIMSCMAKVGGGLTKRDFSFILKVIALTKQYFPDAILEFDVRIYSVYKTKKMSRPVWG